MNQIQLRQHIRKTAHIDEHQAVSQLIHRNPLSQEARDGILNSARQLVTDCRANKASGGTLDAFLLQFGLSNGEGVALMCLAEALLRVPDGLTADRLIAEKIRSGKWSAHRGQSDSLFVNASTWGLMLTGHLVSLDTHITQHPDSWIKRLTATMGEPAIRAAVMQAMRIMGGQYVLGRTIAEGINQGLKKNHSDTLFSFDMLGEGARTDDDARAYLRAYSQAIDEIGVARQKSTGNYSDVYQANGISVKLSALHPRYYFAQHSLVMNELLPRIKQLCQQAKDHNIGLSIDAEESYRLDISLDIFEHLANDADLAGWQGLGFVLQAYQKRAPDTAKWLIAVAKQTKRRLMVRLVKGAYWDAEIKHAQEQGLESYPVFTRKSNTDLCYQHCAELLLDAPQSIFPQFATHNAYTASMILALAGDREFEFQRLHGMGHSLYPQLQKQHPGRPFAVRVYAPIGNHKDLLPYLVRRLLENGANSSFVNRFLDKQTPVEELLNDTRTEVTSTFPYQHKGIPIPERIFEAVGEMRKNARGIDLDSAHETQALLNHAEKFSKDLLLTHSIVNGENAEHELRQHFNPADHSELIGHFSAASQDDVLQALESAYAAQSGWNTKGHTYRADILDKVANYMERDCADLITIIANEAGRTLNDGLSEVREAIDFCRYYATQARHMNLESSLELQGQGVFLCISPWNFPLAIFVGQIAAGLVAGNTVIAKPAMQTPAVAAYAIKLFHLAGVPHQALHLLLGSGSKIGKILIEDPRIAGIAFTGSTATALIINRQLASRPGSPIPFIAETGGQNCMIVDSTALPEQVVDDVISSAFLSAGQRCSALRVLFIQQDIADQVLTMLSGAMSSIKGGNPRHLDTDVGPVIDMGAKHALGAHIDRMTREATLIAKVELNEHCDNGSFVAPHVFEINSLDQLNEEVFGPVLHVIRYSAGQLEQVIQQINDTGYGLTLGIHSRIEAFADTVFRKTIAGNVYINRNMIGAVVGVNPFGGRGLSGTGPKAGGPNYLFRFSSVKDETGLSLTSGGLIFSLIEKTRGRDEIVKVSLASQAMQQWQSSSIKERINILSGDDKSVLLSPETQAIALKNIAMPIELPGPTGEANQLSVHGRGVMLLLIREADLFESALQQIGCALLCGCPLIIAVHQSLKTKLIRVMNNYSKDGTPKHLITIVSLEQSIDLIQHPDISGVIANTADTNSHSLRQIIAKRSGSIIPLIEWPKNNQGYHYHWLLWFLSERTRTENLVAQGGNTQLFNLTE
jgi:RHH-type proline utilization regulon transcriptional repressor/proline dehydrogenase/delta 1-pyrroline-5-carboxylate dehydrogenase